jgi:hypothetical protein
VALQGCTHALAGKVSRVEGTIPSWPVGESDFLETGESHGHDVAVATLLAPFADAVGAPVTTDLGFCAGWGETASTLWSSWWSGWRRVEGI